MEIKKKKKKIGEKEDARNLVEQLSQQGEKKKKIPHLGHLTVVVAPLREVGDGNVIHHPAPRLMDVLT